MDSLPDVGKSEINIVNQQLVNRLKSTDTAFSLGMSILLVFSPDCQLNKPYPLIVGVCLAGKHIPTNVHCVRLHTVPSPSFSRLTRDCQLLLGFILHLFHKRNYSNE